MRGANGFFALGNLFGQSAKPQKYHAEKLTDCPEFTPQSEWVHLPCKVGDRVFTIVIIGGKYSVVADRGHSLKITAENIYAETNWYVEGGKIGYNVFLTQEEAEKALAERRKECVKC